MTASAKLRTYDLYWGGTRIGTIQKDETMELTFAVMAQMIDDVAGFPGGIYQKTSYGLVPKLKFTMYDADKDTINNIVINDFTTTATSGANKQKAFGTIPIDHRDKAKTFMLHPHEKTDLSDQSEDWYFHLAAIDPTSVVIRGSQKNYQTVDLMFDFFPDYNQAQTKTYGYYGYRNITDTPLGSWIQAGKIANVPAKHLTALTLTAGQRDQLQGFNGYGDVTTSPSTAKVANTAGYLATDLSADYDTLSGTFVAGYYRHSSGEVFYVTAVSDTTLTIGARGIWGTTAASWSDGDTITYISSPSVENHTDEGTWASSAAAVTAGNVYMASDTTKKGVIAYVTGSSSANITFTYGGVASPNLVVTT